MIKDTLTYDIVGSFLRPAEIKEARKAYKNSKITKEELTQAEDLAIASLVEKEVAHGLKYVTDGEFRRRWWHLDWLKEFDGFDTIHFTKEINGTTTIAPFTAIAPGDDCAIATKSSISFSSIQ